MKNLLHIIPIPMSGLMLAFMSLGNLFFSIDQTILGHASFLIGVVLWLLLIGKLLFAFSSVVQQMKNPIIASVSPTFTMGTLSFSSGLHFYDVNLTIIHTIWILATIMQIFIILYFIKTFIWNSKVTMANIFPSWLILFVGTAVMPLTAGDLSGRFTQGVVLFAIAAFIILVPIVIVRGFIRKDLPEPTIPMLTILAAPASLSLAAYFKQFESSTAIVITLFVIAQILFILVLTKLPSALKLSFYPSYAAFTFPLVIAATATNAVIEYFAAQGTSYTWLSAYFIIQLTLAILMVLYVYIRYVNYLSIQYRLKSAADAEKTEATS